MGTLRSALAAVPLIEIFLVTFLALESVAEESGCPTSQVALSPRAISVLSTQGLENALNGEAVRKAITETVAKTSISKNLPVHKLLFGLDVSLNQSFSSQTLRSELTVRNASLKELKFGKADVHCEGLRCKVHLPIQDLDLSGDLGVKCLEKPCAGQKMIGLQKLNLRVHKPNTVSGQEPYIEYDALLHPGAPLPELLTLDPKSGKVRLPPRVAKLTLGLDEAEQKGVEKRLSSNLARRKAEFDRRRAREPDCDSLSSLSAQPLGSRGEQFARDLDELGLFAMADSLKPYVENALSLSYLVIAQEALSRDGIEELESFLDPTLWASVGEAANRALRESPFLRKRIEVSVPAVTPAILLGQPDLTESDTPRENLDLDLIGTSKDSSGNLVLHIQSCKDSMQSKAQPSRVRTDPEVARFLKGKKYDLAGSISISEINEYLREIFADPKKNDVFFESLQGKSFLSKLGLNQKVRVRFEEPPQIVSVYNKETQKYEAWITLKVSGKPYIFGQLRNMPIPFLSTRMNSRVRLRFDDAKKVLSADFDKSELALDTSDPISLASDFLTFVTPLLFLKAGLLHTMVVPSLNSSSSIQDPSFQTFGLQELSISGDGEKGTDLHFSAKLAGPPEPGYSRASRVPGTSRKRFRR